MKKLLSLALALALLAAPVAAHATALDAFQALLSEEDAPAAETTAGEACLEDVLAGRYADPGSDAGAVAEALRALTSVTARDLAACAAKKGLSVAQVRNAWYKALAAALSAELAANPDNRDRDENALAILALFLEPEGDEAEKQAIRADMSPESGRRIAEQSRLPEDFVDFVIMSDDWDDDDWRNDSDWQKAYGWAADFDGVALGSRDAPDESRIADMQAALIALGYLKGKADGVFGPRTQAALIEFQLANGLPATGGYGEASARRLQAGDAVARWDYDDDFYDSDDPDTPDTGKRADTPDTPDEEKKPDTPDTPDEEKKPDTPDTPDEKKKADTPDTPDTPDRDSDD